MSLYVKTFFGLSVIGVAIAIGGYTYLQKPIFYSPEVDTTLLSYPSEKHFLNGKFQNEIPVPKIDPDRSRILAWYKFIFTEDTNAIPPEPIPTAKTDLHKLDPKENSMVWMGHSSYYIQTNGKRILVDPVFSEYASPVPGTNKAFEGSNIYTVEDIPKLDYLLISHDHWDHLDYPTIMRLQSKVTKVIAPLGVGSYFTQWGFNPEQVLEGDWDTQFSDSGIDIYILPAYHFSGRLLERNQSLWASFAIITPEQRIYISGDTGYGEHFKSIADRFDGFDIAILECGQYDPQWPAIHMSPEETAKAGKDLNSKVVLAAHNSKFKLAHHAWNDPYIRLTKASEGKNFQLLTPMIGELVTETSTSSSFKQWW